MRRSSRDDDRAGRIAVALVAAVLGGLLAWGIAHPEPPRSEQIAACAAEAVLPCSFLRADGVRMVRWTTPRGVEEITAAAFDQAYLDWLEEMAPPRCERGTGPMNAC